MDPLFKWVGGKRRQAETITAIFPTTPYHYYEPMVGAGAVFFHQTGFNRCLGGQLSDRMVHVVKLFQALVEDPDRLHKEFSQLVGQYNALEGDSNEQGALYYWLRDSWNSKGQTPAVFLFLKAAAYNGLWRENKKGIMNAPWGKYTMVALPSLTTFCDAAGYLAKMEIKHQSVFDVEVAHENSVIYLDPPYRGTFTSFTAEGFTDVDQVRLLDRARSWSDAGHMVIYSNSIASIPLIVEQWPASFAITVNAPRAINTDGTNRGGLDVLVSNKEFLGSLPIELLKDVKE